jgi:hypothetical protein
MSTPLIFTSFASGEVSPSLFGHVDLARMKSSAATMRNLFVRYTGGANSRAGTAFVGYSRQTGRSYPPRLLPFQFSINQGLALEFGNYYMRVIYDGALVTDESLPITGATNANPCVLSISATGGTTASPNIGGVYSSYAPGDQITMAGGSYSWPAIFAVATTKLLGMALSGPGTSGVYAPADTITLAGGTSTVAAVVTVASTQVLGAAIANAGTGGTTSPTGGTTVTGTTGTGTKFQANVTIASGSITYVNYISLAGAYTVNPTAPAVEPITGGGLTGATLNLNIGVLTFTLTTAGLFTANPPGDILTQGATSGSGIGATFFQGLFAPVSMTLVSSGSYTAFPANPVLQASTTGSGYGATFNLTSGAATAFNAGDWLYISGIGGMTQLNGRTVVLGAPVGSNYPIYDVFGNTIDSTSFGAFISSGNGARIYTLATPWAEQDLEYLKIVQSADVVSICCVNQLTGTEYPPYELSRIADNHWTLVQMTTQPTVQPPPWTNGLGQPQPANQSGISAAYYQYVVTSVSLTDGTESIMSPIASIGNTIDVSSSAGTITVQWGSVAGINKYNIYKCTPQIGFATISMGANTPPPVGALFGYAGSSYGTQFLDTNVVPDFTQVPPTHQNPFSRGSVIAANPTATGNNYTYASVTITSATGSGAVIFPVIQYGQSYGGPLVAGPITGYYLAQPGQGYRPGDTFTVSGNGAGATGYLTIGPQSGTYPGAVAYFQERRVYAYTLNQPDTYFMSQPGSYTNFDSRIPTIGTDAIEGSPWSQQVNGIQFMISMPGGLVCLTGLSAWQLTGAGGSSVNPQPITPSDQQAQPQAYNGCSSTVPPIKIDYDIIYVQAKGTTYRDLAYQFFTNIYTGTDLTLNSSHLFFGYTILEHAWCDEPYKLLWSVRSDGVLLSLTYLKPQEIAGWARHDTNGLFKSVCSVVEPPVDALYLAVQRTIGGKTSFMLERMDNRIWNTGVESTWCVDAGLSLASNQPPATISVNSPTGLGAITGVTGLVGGSGWSSATTISIVDNDGQGPGTGAVATPTIVGGVITAINVLPNGSGYVSPAFVAYDPANTGSGFSANATLDNSAVFTTSAPVFSGANIGSVIRMGGGIATITAYMDSQHVTANILTPITSIQPNSISSITPQGIVQPQPSGSWSMNAPVSKITGLYHLAGSVVTGLADGNVIPPSIVSATGVLTLGAPASAVTVGLGFTAQLQSIYLDTGEPTSQGQRKKESAVTVRIEASRGMVAGSNQVDGSTTSPTTLAPVWTNMDPVPDNGVPPYGGNVIPLFTGDARLPVSGGWNTHGQVAIMQTNPLPMNILAIIPEDLAGDTPEQQAKPRQQKSQGR